MHASNRVVSCLRRRSSVIRSSVLCGKLRRGPSPCLHQAHNNTFRDICSRGVIDSGAVVCGRRLGSIEGWGRKQSRRKSGRDGRRECERGEERSGRRDGAREPVRAGGVEQTGGGPEEEGNGHLLHWTQATLCYEILKFNISEHIKETRSPGRLLLRPAPAMRLLGHTDSTAAS